MPIRKPIRNQSSSSFITLSSQESRLSPEGHSSSSHATAPSQETDFPVPDFAKDVEYLTGILNKLGETKSEQLEKYAHQHSTCRDTEPSETNLMTLMDIEPMVLDKVPQNKNSCDPGEEIKSGRRLSMRLSILSSNIISVDNNQTNPSMHRNSLLSLSDILDPKTLENDSAVKEKIKCDSPIRRDSIVLHALRQDIKENRRSIVIHKRSSLSEAVDMYFEDCENNVEMYSASDVDTFRRISSPMSNKRRGSMTDECIISMVVEKMINSDELDESPLDDDISAMSFSDNLDM